jgi:ferric-dicitrate binding protein FerR (iron transport regulator)
VRAIADERKISVTLLEGKILLSKNAENKRQSVVLEKGEQGLIDNLSEELSKNENPDINYLSWKTGIFQFDNQNLENIIKRISEYYNVSYRFENEKLKNCKLTVVFRNQQLKDVLKTISLTLDIEIKLTDNQIVINGKPCK